MAVSLLAAVGLQAELSKGQASLPVLHGEVLDDQGHRALCQLEQVHGTDDDGARGGLRAICMGRPFSNRASCSGIGGIPSDRRVFPQTCCVLCPVRAQDQGRNEVAREVQVCCIARYKSQIVISNKDGRITCACEVHEASSLPLRWRGSTSKLQPWV